MLSRVLLVLCWAQYASGSLEVRMDGKAQTVSLNANVTIPCVLSGYGSLNISVIGVRWSLKMLNSSKEDIVFLYSGGKWTQFRPEANISMSGLRRGDASLHLPHIQLQEGGDYRCEIIIPPNRVQGTAKLDIMAMPSSILLPPETIVKEKKAYTLKCTVTKFYPEPVNMTWKKMVPGPQSLDVEILEGISMSSIRNNDGTFNATSSFILHPVLEDNGTIYRCVVAHKSLLIPLQSSTILTISDSLEVKMDGKVQIVSLNANVTISCMLSGYGVPPLEIRDIDIRWSFIRPNSDKEEKVFEFCRGQPIQYRPEANISMSRLMEGDASLYLSHVQLQEAGEYTCEVLISPRRAQGTIRLDIVAQPSSKEDEEPSLQCTRTESFPQSVHILCQIVILDLLFESTCPLRSKSNIQCYQGLGPGVTSNGDFYQCGIVSNLLSASLPLNIPLSMPRHRKNYFFYMIFVPLLFFGIIWCSRFQRGSGPRTHMFMKEPALDVSLEGRCYYYPHSMDENVPK